MRASYRMKDRSATHLHGYTLHPVQHQKQSQRADMQAFINEKTAN